MRQNNFCGQLRGRRRSSATSRCCGEISEKLGRGWYAVVGGNKRNLREQIRSVSSRITPRISLKKERMSELATWHQSGIIPSDVFFSFYLKGRKMFFLPVGVKRKLAKARSTIARKKKKKKRHRTHAVKLNLITLHEIRYRLVFQMTMKRFLPRWLGIYTSYCYFLPSSVPTMDSIIWNDCRA